MNLRIGSIGEQVRHLEHLLAREGYSLQPDALFEAETEAAVKHYQARMGLVVDGIVGDKTLGTLTARSKDSRYLTMAKIKASAAALGVNTSAVLAVNEVESRGAGFLADGRPVILYERHIMYRRLKEAGIDAEAVARRNPIVDSKPGGYKGGSAEYVRLKSAQYVDIEVALESCSWGAFQIMGFHWKRLGYTSIHDFVAKMAISEDEQFYAFTNFITSDPALLKALKAHKWADFARLYNGPNYKANLYDIKLARAYERYSSFEKAVA